MEDASLTLTLFHDGQFYVGIFERREGKQLSVCRVVFGAEPKDGEIMDFLNRDLQSHRKNRREDDKGTEGSGKAGGLCAASGKEKGKAPWPLTHGAAVNGGIKNGRGSE